MDESRGGGTSGLEGELVGKIEARGRREEGGINVIMDNNALQDSGENWSYGDWSVVGGRGRR
jgi:hypothetical protein